MENKTTIYIKFEGISGTNKIKCLGWSHSFDQQTIGNHSEKISGSIGKATHTDLNIVKQLDNASCELLDRCWKGTPIKNATITSYQNDKKYLEILMEDVIITHVNINESSGSYRATESYSLAYGKITYSYTPTDDESGDTRNSVSTKL